MWRATILQALLDACNLGRSLNPSWPEWKHEKVRCEATDWLLGDSQDFAEVCEAADIQKEYIAKFALRISKGDNKAKQLLIEWRDTFAKQGRKIKNGVEVELEPDVSDKIF